MRCGWAGCVDTSAWDRSAEVVVVPGLATGIRLVCEGIRPDILGYWFCFRACHHGARVRSGGRGLGAGRANVYLAEERNRPDLQKRKFGQYALLGFQFEGQYVQ